MFILRRWGTFSCAIKPGTPHCGLDGRVLKIFKYQIICRADDAALDDYGFLIDNQTVTGYFDRWGPDNPVTVSCECFAKQAAMELFNLIPRKECCQSIDATIEPFDGASITYRWIRPEDTRPLAAQLGGPPITLSDM